MIKRSWCEIDLSTITSNYFIYKRFLKPGQSIMAVVKANGYGHGDIEIATALQAVGCSDFAVSNVEEGVRLRKAGIKGQILVLGYTPVESIKKVFEFDLTQTIISADYAEAISSLGYRIKAQFAIDTGMSRIGLLCDQKKLCEQTIRKYHSVFHLNGLFTHLSVADDPNESDFTKKQIQAFRDIENLVSDLKMPYIHCLNSAGGLNYNYFGNIVRLGIVLYGLKPNEHFCMPAGIKPALSWKSVIAMVKTVNKGSFVGYGKSYLAKKRMTIATIPTGYADGFNRRLSNRGFVFINGQKANIVGKICMDQFMVDVTGFEGLRIGDECILLDSSFTADDMAKAIDTIGYEVVCGITGRVLRVYK